MKSQFIGLRMLTKWLAHEVTKPKYPTLDELMAGMPPMAPSAPGPRPAAPIIPEPNRYHYTWQLPSGTKRFEGTAYGQTWDEALEYIRREHPRRTQVRPVMAPVAPEVTYPKIPEARVRELKHHENLVLQAIKDKPGITLPELEQATRLEPVQIDGAIRRLGEGVVIKKEGQMTPGGLKPSSYRLVTEAAPGPAPATPPAEAVAPRVPGAAIPEPAATAAKLPGELKWVIDRLRNEGTVEQPLFTFRGRLPPHQEHSLASWLAHRATEKNSGVVVVSDGSFQVTTPQGMLAINMPRGATREIFVWTEGPGSIVPQRAVRPSEPSTASQALQGPAAPGLSPIDMPTTAETKPKIGTSCIPCSVNHLSTCSGLLSEALRFARTDGLASSEVTDRLGLCQDEINAMERVDLRAENIVQLEPQERELAQELLVKTRSLRHKLEHLDNTTGLEELTAGVQRLRAEVGKKWLLNKFQSLPPEQQTKIKQAVLEKLSPPQG